MQVNYNGSQSEKLFENSVKGHLYKIKNNQDQTIGYLFGTMHEIDKEKQPLLDAKIFKSLSRSKALFLEIKRWDEKVIVEELRRNNEAMRNHPIFSNFVEQSVPDEEELLKEAQQIVEQIKTNPKAVEDLLMIKADSLGIELGALETEDSRNTAFKSINKNEMDSLEIKKNGFIAILLEQSLHSLQQASQNITNLDVEAIFSHLSEGYGFLAEAIKNVDFDKTHKNVNIIEKLVNNYEKIFNVAKSIPNLNSSLIEQLDEGIKILKTLYLAEQNKNAVKSVKLKSHWYKGKVLNISDTNSAFDAKLIEFTKKTTFLRDNTMVDKIHDHLQRSSKIDRGFYAIGSYHVIGDYKNVKKRLEQKGWKLGDAYKTSHANIPEEKSEQLTDLNKSLKIFPKWNNKETSLPANVSEIQNNEEFQSRALQLKKLRLQNPDLYPAYFDELLQHNSIHTFDHLIQMNELNSRLEVGKAVNKMELSEITSILLETKKMMINKVKSSLNENCKDMVFILGGTGSGKSTTWSFLKGDKMVLKWGNYESEANQNHYISHSTTNSFTFLPNIVIKDNCAMVDFPGFDDTKGPLISLGMELALKSLIEEYHPKVLLLESITNTEGRFANVDRHSSRMARILDNKNECILGLTKYSNQVNFMQLEALKEARLQERLRTLKGLKIQLQAIKKVQEELKSDALLTLIDESEREIKSLEENVNLTLTFVEENEAMKIQRAALEKLENTFLTHMDLTHLIRFKELENSDPLEDSFKKLWAANPIRINPKPALDSYDEALLKERFQKDVFEQLKSARVSLHIFETLQDFESSLLEHGFMYTIIKSGFPEIAPLLQQPEFESIVNQYDKKALDDFENNLVNKLDSLSVNSISIKDINEKLRESQDFQDAFKNTLTKIKRYIELITQIQS